MAFVGCRGSVGPCVGLRSLSMAFMGCGGPAFTFIGCGGPTLVPVAKLVPVVEKKNLPGLEPYVSSLLVVVVSDEVV